MSREREALLLVDGRDAPPRANGELVFAEPWESRAFGMAVGLCERGLFEWDEFRGHLIAEIGSWERAHPDGRGFRYYAHWLVALEKLLADKGLLSPAELERRQREFGARPHGHDH